MLPHMTLFPHPFRAPIARGLALFLALFTLLNLLGSLRSPGFDANYWWIDIGYLPRLASHSALLASAIALLSFGIGFPNHFLVRRILQIISATLAAAVFWNVLSFYFLWLIGHIHPGVPIPFSLLLSFVLAFILRASFLPWKLPTKWQRILLIATLLASFFLFPLAQMYCFGKTDYRRKADAIVVFGARTYADGTPSQALADRVRTAVELYHDHLAQFLIFSGGPGEGPTSEPQAMRTLALSLKVPDSAILLDEQGLNTDLTVSNTVTLFRARHFTSILAVSHFYHLPRVKMTYTRALHSDASTKTPIITVYTVPAKESAPLVAMPLHRPRSRRPLGVLPAPPLAMTLTPYLARFLIRLPDTAPLFASTNRKSSSFHSFA